ncbi:CsxC family protein [Alkalihalobacterium chitinilyticum]|uniref:DUF7852 domain-containing protein n=1 Tax=Alkalihalobacterium chitinilyticum TaxID=2980103 RepID=A0ABT5VD83_9BACI|nr:hypothetical protein [Alkalihalobacterium chitinilyticum]MDE5412692.1 hypothetical protein [Alkalihalobacterium chitinilyticum]
MGFYKKGKHHHDKSCKTADYSKTLRCDNEKYGYETTGYAVVPVVVADEWIQVDVEAVERLPKPAKEIKRIRKNVHLTQCKLVQSQFSNPESPAYGSYGDTNGNGCCPFYPGKYKLYIEGFVRKNIEYVPSCSGAVEHHTVDTPFHCVVKPDVYGFDPTKLSVKNGIYELVYNDKKGMGMDSKVQGFATYEYFNDMPFCKLEWAGVTELDIAEDWKKGCNVFRTVREKMIVEMRLKVLQMQQKDINNGNDTPKG